MTDPKRNSYILLSGKFFLLIFNLYFLFSTAIMAQNSNQSAFISPVIKFQSISNHASYISGARFGWVINDRFILGGGFYGSLNAIPTDIIDSQKGNKVLLNFNMGGLEFEYIFIRSEFIKTSFVFFGGSGGLHFSDQPNNSYSKNILVWEPELYSEIKIVRWFWCGLGAGYRIITYTNDPSDPYGININGLFGLLIIKFCTE